MRGNNGNIPFGDTLLHVCLETRNIDTLYHHPICVSGRILHRLLHLDSVGVTQNLSVR